jgi:hypothetical protein
VKKEIAWLNVVVHIIQRPKAKGRPRRVGAPDRLIVWRPFKLIIFKLFRSRTETTNIYDEAWPRYGQCRRNSFARGNLSLPAPYFLLCQSCLSADWRPGQLPGWPAPQSFLAKETATILLKNVVFYVHATKARIHSFLTKLRSIYTRERTPAHID